VQGEAASLDSVAGPKAADLVICHNVLEYVDSPADAMTAIAAVLRPSATVSVLAANAVAAVLHRALAGRFTEARQLLETDGAAGTPRRFTLLALTALIEGAGLRAGEAYGLRIFSGLVPGALLDGDAGGAGGTEALRALEVAAAAAPPLRDIAAQLHLLGHR
jgi:SAM-dependent methyltransferase